WGDLPDPAPAAGQALVRVHGAGVGPWDVGVLSGGFPGVPLPFVPGQEVAGVVEAAGDGAGVQPGERVYAALFPAGGGFAEPALASAHRRGPRAGPAHLREAARRGAGWPRCRAQRTSWRRPGWSSAPAPRTRDWSAGGGYRPGKPCSSPPPPAAWAAPPCRSRRPWAPAWWPWPARPTMITC